jgi:predicted AAA+ superfamily ATPase
MGIALRFFRPPDRSFFLFGPRGTGKSTLVKGAYANIKVIDLLSPSLVRQYRARPELFIDLVLANHMIKTFIIDEVQKVPELLSIVHKLIEEKKGWQFILTGSSARKLKQSGVDLLAGRAQLKFLHPFMAAEIPELFDLEKNLKLGMVPLIIDSPDPNEDLKNYIALYMQEEVQMERLIRKVDEFSYFLEIISLSQASTLNYTNIARDCHISAKTVESYITILEDLLLSFRLEVFSKRAKRNLTSHPKFYYFDAGIFRSVRPMGPLDVASDINGLAFETLIAQHLRAWLDYSDQSGKLYFWRTKSDLEVDFIIYGEIGFYAIEVKNSDRVRPGELRGLQEFKKDYPEAECALVYRGKDRIMIQDILCIPAEEFLLNLLPNNHIIRK